VNLGGESKPLLQKEESGERLRKKTITPLQAKKISRRKSRCRFPRVVRKKAERDISELFSRRGHLCKKLSLTGGQTGGSSCPALIARKGIYWV